MTSDPESPSPSAKPRREVDLEDLRLDLSLALQAVAGRAVKEAASREAFAVIAGALVDHFKARDYRITAPPPTEMHSMVSYPNAYRRDRKG